MDKLSFFWRKIVEIYQQVFSMLRKNPTVLLLFVLTGICDLAALLGLFFAPSPPVSYVLAPIIRTFWSERFLHYPENFLLLPKLFNHAHFLLSTVIGVFVTGLVVKKIQADQAGEKLSVLGAARPIFTKYGSLVVAWLISYGFFVFALKGLLALLPRNFLLQLSSGFVFGIFAQSLVAFLLPALIILESGFFKAAWEGLRFGARNMTLMSAVIFSPMLLAFGFSYLKLYTPYFVRIHPEFVLWVLAGGIVVSLVIDVFVTTSATLLFLKVRHNR